MFSAVVLGLKSFAPIQMICGSSTEARPPVLAKYVRISSRKTGGLRFQKICRYRAADGKVRAVATIRIREMGSDYWKMIGDRVEK
jgi:hypothetical protein